MIVDYRSTPVMHGLSSSLSARRRTLLNIGLLLCTDNRALLMASSVVGSHQLDASNMWIRLLEITNVGV